MDLTTCSVCVLAGSAGGAVTGFYASRQRRRGRRAAGRRGQGRTGRSWPGSTPAPREDGTDGPDGGGAT